MDWYLHPKERSTIENLHFKLSITLQECTLTTTYKELLTDEDHPKNSLIAIIKFTFQILNILLGLGLQNANLMSQKTWNSSLDWLVCAWIDCIAALIWFHWDLLSTVKVIWIFFSFHGGGLQVPLGMLSQSQAGTWVDPPSCC